ncbi:MAG: enolase C-terminal domain-like protein [Verrucomicrobiota bacterium]
MNTESLSRGGAKTIKVKVGVGNRSEERQQIKTLIGEAKGDVRIRLDANQVFDLGQTADWIEWASDLQEIEFIEQPMPVGSEEMIFDEFGEEARKIALDESVVSEASLDRFLDMDWPGPFVIKPSLFGNPESLIALPESVRGRLVLSSAFETGIGFSWVLALADQLVGKKRDHGLGTRGWFGADGLDGWSAGTHFSGEITEERLEKVWNNAAVF